MFDVQPGLWNILSYCGGRAAVKNGGADAARGSGLRGIADRVAALDGTLTLERPQGSGTHLHVEIPC